MGNEKERFDAFMDAYAGYVHAVVYRVAGNHVQKEDVEECAADVLVALWNARDRVDYSAEDAKRYIATAARNRAVSLIQKVKRNSFVPLNEDTFATGDHDPLVKIEREEVAALLNEAIESLPPPDPEIFVRRYYFGDGLLEIAAALSLTERAVEGRIYRGKKQLRAYLEGRLFHEV